MSLLQQDSPVLDDAARGEEFTKGSTHVLRASILAAVLVSIGMAVYVITGEKPPAATGQIINVTAHAMHRQSSGFDANGAPMPKADFDQILVFTHVKLHNQSHNPIFLRQVMTNLSLDDGITTSSAAIPADYERLFVAYPELGPVHGKPLTTDATIAAGQTLEGDFVSAFRLTQQQWEARKGLTYNISFRYLPDLVLTQTGPISSI